MRSTSVLLVLVAGCSSDPDLQLNRVSTLAAQTDGVVVHDRRTATAAMADQLCRLDTRAAEVRGDLDPSKGAETLLDARGDAILAADGELLLVAADGTEHLGFAALDARLTDVSVIALAAYEGGCAVVSDAARLVPDLDCTGDVGFAVDRATGVAWVADGRSLAVVAPDGAFVRRDLAANRVVFDPASAYVVVGRRGETWLRGIDADGADVWVDQVPGALDHLAVARGMVVAMVDAELVVVDPADGAVAARHPLPVTARVSVAADGRSLALATPDEVHFYDVDVGGRGLSLLGSDDADAWQWLPGVGGAGAAGVIAGVATTIPLFVD